MTNYANKEERRTKPICNPGAGDRFFHPRAEGVWRRTNTAIKLKEGKYYEVQRTDENETGYLLGSERVDLIKEEEA